MFMYAHVFVCAWLCTYVRVCLWVLCVCVSLRICAIVLRISIYLQVHANFESMNTPTVQTDLDDIALKRLL